MLEREAAQRSPSIAGASSSSRRVLDVSSTLERPLEPGQVHDGQALLAPRPDHAPRLAELCVVVAGVANDLAALVREPVAHRAQSCTGPIAELVLTVAL